MLQVSVQFQNKYLSPSKMNVVIEVKLSDFYIITFTVMEKGFKKPQPKIKNYCSFNHFSNEAYKEILINKFSKNN